MYSFFEALAVCHTVQVAGSYEENEDRAQEEEENDEHESFLNFTGEIPPIFHKSLEELNDLENETVREEIDFITTRQTVTFENRNENSISDDRRPSSDMIHPKKHDFTHRRPSSLSNIQFSNPSVFPPVSDTVKHVEFAKDNVLLRRVQQQQFKRTVSNNTDEKVNRKDTMHRRTQSSVPFGISGEY